MKCLKLDGVVYHDYGDVNFSVTFHVLQLFLLRGGGNIGQQFQLAVWLVVNVHLCHLLTAQHLLSSVDCHSLAEGCCDPTKMGSSRFCLKYSD
jgi:hypothetical protein